jgi:hypothetical protein
MGVTGYAWFKVGGRGESETENERFEWLERRNSQKEVHVER